jgi:hypothetical protein
MGRVKAASVLLLQTSSGVRNPREPGEESGPPAIICLARRECLWLETLLAESKDWTCLS